MTKFARFCLSLYKNSANILSDLKAVPYMDFSQEWTDEKLFKHFNLNKDEIKFINEYIPNWYERDFK
jgi:site-specific DNA-methyltransferase (adenine-specific)